MPSTWNADDWFHILENLVFAERPQLFLDLMNECAFSWAGFAAAEPGNTGVFHVLARLAAKPALGTGPACTNAGVLWIEQAKTYACMGAALQSKDEYGCTPSMLFLRGTRWQFYTDTIDPWIRAMNRVGVDSCASGAVEKKAIMENEWYSSVLRNHGILGLSYGSRPGDWRLWFRQAGDLYAEAFWDHIDHPERRIPGTWPCENEPLPPLERWARKPRFLSYGVKRRTLRRLNARAKGLMGGGDPDTATLKSLCGLRSFNREYGRLRRTGALIPDELVRQMREFASDLGFCFWHTECSHNVCVFMRWPGFRRVDNDKSSLFYTRLSVAIRP